MTEMEAIFMAVRANVIERARMRDATIPRQTNYGIMAPTKAEFPTPIRKRRVRLVAPLKRRRLQPVRKYKYNASVASTG